MLVVEAERSDTEPLGVKETDEVGVGDEGGEVVSDIVGGWVDLVLDGRRVVVVVVVVVGWRGGARKAVFVEVCYDGDGGVGDDDDDARGGVVRLLGRT